MKRDIFLDLLKDADPKKINEYIESKGKKGKPINPLVFDDEKLEKR